MDIGGVGSEIEESERSSVDIGNTLGPDGSPARRILFLGVAQRPPVVTRFGRVVKVGYLEMHSGGSQLPSPGQLLG